MTAALASACGHTRAPEPPPPAADRDARWSREVVAKDVALLRRVLGTLHPGLYRYLDDAALDAAYARLADELAAARTLGDGYVALARFTAAIRCGHTFPNPANQSDAVRAALLDGPRLPFLFRWIDGEAVVTRALTGDARLAPGTRVVAFGGVAARDVLARLLPLARADGGNDAKRVATLELRGLDADEELDLLYPLVFGLGASIVLDVVSPDGAQTTIEVATMAAAARRAAVAAPDDDAEPSARWSVEVSDEGVAYVAMPTWVMYRSKRDWKADVTALVAQLVTRGARTLVLDLRGNEGGDDVGNELVRHLIVAPLEVDRLERRVRYRRVPDALRPALDTWDPSFFDWGGDATAIDARWFRLAGEATDETLTPLAPRFGGRVIVLVDAANSSATFQFAQLVQRHRLATLVGQPTGGNQRGINGGAFFFLRLPGLGLEVDVPLIARYPRDGNLDALPDAGLQPDVAVPLTAADVAAGRDPALEAARRLR